MFLYFLLWSRRSILIVASLKYSEILNYKSVQCAWGVGLSLLINECNISKCLVPCGPIPFNEQPNFFVDRIINYYINSLKILGKKIYKRASLGSFVHAKQ